ncbi:MAG: phosphatidylglycerol lysyltransferase domain-containing protein [Marmoricola sp.]
MGKALWQRLQEPSWVGRIVAFLGLVTIVSALLPPMRARLHVVTDVLPATFPAAATTGALATGVLLVLLSRGLRRAKFRAWALATVITAITAALHLVKGLDVEEAVLSLALLVLLLSSRSHFTARPDPRSLTRVLTVLIVGPIVATALGWAWIGIDADGQAASTTTAQRIEQAFLGLVGIPGPVHFLDRTDADHAAIGLVVLGASLLIPLLVLALQPADGPHPMSPEEAAAVGVLLERWGRVDSLSYFATREDRSVIFSRTGKAAVSYRVVGSVSLAAGDPLGDPEAWPGAIEAWLEEARSFGWVPAVLGASEAAATAYHRAGLDALELGDEAVVHVGEFSLEGRSMRVVRQAVSRCTRAGLSVTCQRVRDLDDEERALIRTKADEWRDGDVERGFSMALGRFVDERDGDAVVVLCRDGGGQLRGLLNLVPWGEDGLSLDLMRRDRGTENGIVEHMVTALWEACPELGVHRFSLNFAVFRNVFARGERLGAGPALRLWRSVLLAASRFWQIETLSRANAKYQPEWVPRFVLFRSAGDLPRVGTAALRAEAFLVAPRWWQRLAGRVEVGS